MKLADFQYDLPRELIAQEPLKERDAARLMVLGRRDGGIEVKRFREITDHIDIGDCLVLNDTKVIPARLYGKRSTGARVEVFFLEETAGRVKALLRPSRRIKTGEKLILDGGYHVIAGERCGKARFVSFDAPVNEVLKTGHVPLPPYITREEIPGDKEDYQTVYAEKAGATAAPTAGLHFTEQLLGKIGKQGAVMAKITLHTGYGTFSPVEEELIEDHVMHKERFSISEKAAESVNGARTAGKKIIAVGTTSVRALESSAGEDGKISPKKGETDLFIYPGYKYRAVDGLVTNFHLPGSTLLMLAAAFCGKELLFKAYKAAVDMKFRFFSYGDAMLII